MVYNGNKVNFISQQHILTTVSKHKEKRVNRKVTQQWLNDVRQCAQ
jgi:hypothetical protein